MTYRTPHVARVEQYYDANTSAFARYGQGAGTGTIRRAVWAPSVQDDSQAFAYVDELILAEVQRAASAATSRVQVLDLGCGVGGSLCFLAQRAAIHGVGVTISSIQADIARARAAALSLSERLDFRHGDFTHPLTDLAPGQLVFSIEAFIHAPSPDAYFEAAARLLTEGGQLIVCDDVLSQRALGALSTREARWLERFREGWLAQSLVTRAAADAAAQRAGFVACADYDLTDYLELNRPRDLALRALLPVLDHVPFGPYRRSSWRGGDALQRCLLAGLVEYRYMTWRLRG